MQSSQYHIGISISMWDWRDKNALKGVSSKVRIYGNILVIASVYTNNAAEKLYFKYVNLIANFKAIMQKRIKAKNSRVHGYIKCNLYIHESIFYEFQRYIFNKVRVFF